MTSGWLLWRRYYTFLLKKCPRPCPGLSMCLFERTNWIISSFPRWISKILFVLGSWNHFCSQGCRIGECPFRYVLILFLGSVIWPNKFELMHRNKSAKMATWQKSSQIEDKLNYFIFVLGSWNDSGRLWIRIGTWKMYEHRGTRVHLNRWTYATVRWVRVDYLAKIWLNLS